jgi:hypothetical protein
MTAKNPTKHAHSCKKNTVTYLILLQTARRMDQQKNKNTKIPKIQASVCVYYCIIHNCRIKYLNPHCVEYITSSLHMTSSIVTVATSTLHLAIGGVSQTTPLPTPAAQRPSCNVTGYAPQQMTYLG